MIKKILNKNVIKYYSSLYHKNILIVAYVIKMTNCIKYWIKCK